MEDLTDEERRVLRALSELEPATLEEIALRTGLPRRHVEKLLDGLAKRGLLGSAEPDEPAEEDSGGG